MVVEAGGIAFFKRFAPAHGVDAVERVDKGVERACVGVGAEIGRAVFEDAPRFDDARKIFVCDPQNGIGFAVFQIDVVTRIVFFNKIVFEQKGFIFVCRCDILD